MKSVLTAQSQASAVPFLPSAPLDHRRQGSELPDAAWVGWRGGGKQGPRAGRLFQNSLIKLPPLPPASTPGPFQLERENGVLSRSEQEPFHMQCCGSVEQSSGSPQPLCPVNKIPGIPGHTEDP